MKHNTEKENHDEPVVIARVGSLVQADVICAVLRTNEIESFIVNENVSHNLPHLGYAVYPNGVPITVRKSDQAEAQQILEQNGLLTEESEPFIESNVTDRFARKAGVTGLFAVLFSPFIFLTFWYFCRALKSRKKHPPTNLDQFRRNMTLAKLCMTVAVIVVVIFIVIFFSGT